MKRFAAFAALAILSGPPHAFLHAEGLNKRDHAKMEERMEERKAKRLERMTKELNLTADQQKSVKEALDAQSAKMKEMHRDSGDQMKALKEETDGKINAVLTDEQKAKFATMKEDMKKDHMKRLDGKKRGEAK